MFWKQPLHASNVVLQQGMTAVLILVFSFIYHFGLDSDKHFTGSGVEIVLGIVQLKELLVNYVAVETFVLLF